MAGRRSEGCGGAAGDEADDAALADEEVGVGKTAGRSGAIPSNIDIARAVNGNGRGNVIGIAWSIVAGNLLLYARGVVLDRGVIFAGT